MRIIPSDLPINRAAADGVKKISFMGFLLLSPNKKGLTLP